MFYVLSRLRRHVENWGERARLVCRWRSWPAENRRHVWRGRRGTHLWPRLCSEDCAPWNISRIMIPSMLDDLDLSGWIVRSDP